MLKLKQTVRLSVSKIPAVAHRGLFVIATAVLVGTSLTYGAPQRAVADQYDNQINALRQQNASAQSAVNGLQAQAATYQDAINQLQTQINSLQSSIDANVAEQNSLRQQITDAQNQINQQRAYLATNVKAMYVDGTPTTLEVLATSKNLSDFVDKQEYRTTVQNKLRDTLKRIADLQAQLKTKETAVEQLLSDQRTQQAQLDSDRSQQQQLLNYNESQQSAYTNQLKANNAEIARVQAIQRAAYAAAIGGGSTSPTGSPVKYKNYTGGRSCGGGYSYCWAGFDQYLQSTLDKWGLEWARECVHYVADYLDREGKRVPNFGGGNGYANKWVGYTTRNGYATLTTSPQHGDVVYMPLAGYGHVGIVEYVNSDGTVHVSQMNWPYGGYYSELDLYVTSGVQFLHFQ